MAYTTKAKIEALFGVTLTSAQNSALTDVIAAVQAFIDGYCEQTFESVRETRYYDSAGSCELITDNFTTGSMAVEVLNSNGSVQRTLRKGQSNDYIVSPYNVPTKNKVILTRTGGLGSFPCGKAQVRVSALFGFGSTVPADISIAATKLSYQLLRTDTPEGTQLSSVRLGDYSATYQVLNDAAQALGLMTILDSYRDIEI